MTKRVQMRNGAGITILLQDDCAQFEKLFIKFYILVFFIEIEVHYFSPSLSFL